MRELVHQLHKEVIEYFAAIDISQIEHTEAVHNFAQLIASLEKCDEHKQFLIEVSALLHDIGCPNAKEKYGNTLPANQEKEGKIIAEKFLKKYPIKEVDKILIAKVVGAHHHPQTLNELGFDILIEADLIVNILEGYYKIEQAPTLFKNMVVTKSGKELFQKMFLT